jgi:hypothetical protein
MISSKKQFVYIGQYYHIKNKELPLDYKFGVTDNLDQREYSLGRTKSPIKYMILKAWELPINVKSEKVEKLIETIFSEQKYDGCEWYDIDGDLFKDKISSLFHIISDMVSDVDFSFTEVSLDESEGDVIEKEIEKEIRTGKKSPWTNLKIEIDGIDISEDSAKKGFVKTIQKILENTSLVDFSIDFNKIFKSNKNDYAEYKQNQAEEINGFYLDTQSSTKEKYKILNDIFNKYKINGKVEII